MLNLGTQNIPALYLGGEQIQKAYLGEAVVLGSGSEPGPSRLPEGYTEVEYIQSSGTQYIDTDIAPRFVNSKIDTKVTIDVQKTSTITTTESYFGCRWYTGRFSSDRYYSSFFVYSYNNGLFAAFGYGNPVPSKELISNVAAERNLITLDGPNRIASIGDVVVPLTDLSGYTISSAQPDIYLLGLRSYFASDGTSDVVSKMPAKLYSCQIEKGGELVRDFVPCIDPTGAVGLYDLVEGKFYANAGTGAFTAGPAV